MKQKNRKRKCSEETKTEKQVRLETARQYKKILLSNESETQRSVRLQLHKERQRRNRACESQTQKHIRLQKQTERRKLRKLNETEAERSIRLERERLRKREQRQRQSKSDGRHSGNCCANTSQEGFLNEFDNDKNGKINEQGWAKSNITKFNKRTKHTIYQCTLCKEAWLLKATPNNKSSYVCARCTRNKGVPKKFSVSNCIVPSSVPLQLQELTQTEEMIIARALPIMRVYIKPGGQRGYRGHCVNLPQNVQELANSLSRQPKELLVIIVKVKGSDNSFKDVTVRRQKVHDALLWLIANNPLYANVTIDLQSLNALPQNGIPPDLLTVQSKEESLKNHYSVTQTDMTSDNPYSGTDEMSSFLPVGENQELEFEGIRNQLSNDCVEED